MAGRAMALTLVVLGALLMVQIGASGEQSPGHSGRCFESSVDDDQLPLDDQTIIIDPGHGGEDVGAISGELEESQVTLDISNRLRAMLLDSGARACQTRTDDDYLSRAERAEFANQNDGDIFVSVHLNSFNDPGPGYTLTLWYGNADRLLAQALVGAMIDQLGRSPEGELSPVNGGRQSRFNSGMLRDADMPAVIAEPIFMSNSWEAEALAEGGWRQEQIAMALHDGIVAYVRQDYRLLVRATATAQDVVETGVGGWLSWLEASGSWSARKVAAGIHASAGLDHLSLIGIELN